MPDPDGPQGAVAAFALACLILVLAIGAALIWLSAQYVGGFAKGVYWRRALIVAYLVILAGVVYQLFGFWWAVDVLLSLPIMWYLVFGGILIVVLSRCVVRIWSDLTGVLSRQRKSYSEPHNTPPCA
jgi:hypothetical protein